MSKQSELLESLLNSSGSVPGFFKEIFSFLANRTDFYHISNGTDDPAGMPPGFAEDIMIKMFYQCNPNVQFTESMNYLEMFKRNLWLKHNAFLPASVAEEVEVVTSVDDDVESFVIDVNENVDNETTIADDSGQLNMESLNINHTVNDINEVEVEQPAIENQNTLLTSKVEAVDNKLCSESFNGAIRENYTWSQNISEIDVTIRIPTGVSSSKQLKITILSDSFWVQYITCDSNWSTLVKDKLSHKIRAAETVWVMSEGFIRIHLEKQMERWWNALLENEPKIDTSKLNCSRPLHDLPDEQVEKIRELQWNHMQKLAGKPTSDEINREKTLRQAWNMPGSPFANTPFDPNVLS